MPRYLHTRDVLRLSLGVSLGLAVCPDAMLAQDARAGQMLYQQYCTVCHGSNGESNGPAARAMNPRPRGHTNGAYMNKLSDALLTKVISQGGAAVGRSPLCRRGRTRTSSSKWRIMEHVRLTDEYA